MARALDSFSTHVHRACPRTTTEPPASMRCPHDHTPLLAHQRDDVEVWSCLQCRGVWFPRASLDRLTLKGKAAAVETQVPVKLTSFVIRHLACPTCAKSRLQTRFEGQLEVSRCRNCGGLWLTKSEVTKLLSSRGARPQSTTGVTRKADSGVGTDLAAGAVEAGSLLATGEAIGLDTVLAEFVASLF